MADMDIYIRCIHWNRCGEPVEWVNRRPKAWVECSDCARPDLSGRVAELEAQLLEASELLEKPIGYGVGILCVAEAVKVVLAESEAQLAEARKVINRCAAQVGHPPIAPGELGVESVAEAVERRHAHAREREETLDSITPENLQAFAACEVHHEEHHEREKELEARLAEAIRERDKTVEQCNGHFDKWQDEANAMRKQLAEANARAEKAERLSGGLMIDLHNMQIGRLVAEAQLAEANARAEAAERNYHALWAQDNQRAEAAEARAEAMRKVVEGAA
jgi:DNA repair exonuclease SbcCD ATPase subunit